MLRYSSLIRVETPLCPWAVDTNLTRQVGFAQEIAGLLNCSTTDNEMLVECMRNVEVNPLLAAQALVSRSSFKDMKMGGGGGGTCAKIIIIIINDFYRAQITIKSLSALIEGKIKNRQTEKQKEEKKWKGTS